MQGRWEIQGVPLVASYDKRLHTVLDILSPANTREGQFWLFSPELTIQVPHLVVSYDKQRFTVVEF